jgi:hypothetical protein
MLGKPDFWWTQFIYTNRFMWVDSRSRLYLTAGNQRDIWYQGEQADVFSKVCYYDPSGGFGVMNQGELVAPNSIEMGQWNREHTKCYLSDTRGSLYCFTDEGPSWKYLGTPDYPSSWETWVMHVSADEEKVYLGRSDDNIAIYEFDIASKTTSQLCTIGELDDQAGSKESITGYDAWDNAGNFYFSSFTANDGKNVLMIRVNPVMLKAANGTIPLTEVTTSISPDGRQITISRNIPSAAPCTILWEAGKNSFIAETPEKIFGKTTIPAGLTSVTLPADSISIYNHNTMTDIKFQIIPDGNDYITGVHDSVSIPPPSGARRSTPSVNSRSAVVPDVWSWADGSVAFRFDLTKPSMVRLTIFALSGKASVISTDKFMESGHHEIDLDPFLSDGLYIAVLHVDGKSVNRTLIISR